MTHAYKPKWSDFANENLGPNLPLTNSQMTIPISGVLPSGESNLFDSSQYHNIRSESPSHRGSGINTPYPYPNTNTARQYAYISGDNTTNKFNTNWWEVSGIVKTYPSDDGKLVDESRESGIFHYNFSKSAFSNGSQAQSRQIENFTIFNNYIHHQLINQTIISIPYVSTFKMSINWNPYG